MKSYSKKDIEAAANKLRNDAGVSTSRIDFQKVFEYLGLRVAKISKDKKGSKYDNISGWLDRENRVVGINASEPRRRKIFTIAHEVGHFVLHEPDDEKIGKLQIDFREVKQLKFGKKDAKEREADYFAACLLMPKDQFQDYYKKLNGKLRIVSDIFDVSLMSASIRAIDLGLID